MGNEQGPQGVQGVQGIQGIHGDHGTYVSQATCNYLHAESDKKYDKLFLLMEKIDKRLYHDNGTVSIQTRLDRGDRILGILCWAMSIAGGALIIALLTLAWKTILKVWLI
jgi:hypothetical protein